MRQPPAPSPRPFLILASNSPRRRELLRDAGYSFAVVPPADDVECGACGATSPAELVAELAYRKAVAVWRQLFGRPQLHIGNPNPVIVAADTVAECDGFILGKPRNEEDARAMLTKLSGREHRVLTGVCLLLLRVGARLSDPPLPLGEGRGEGDLPKTKTRMPAHLLAFARDLRKTQTDAEQLMWSLLRDRRITGCKFRRQHPILPYVLDFYCHEHRLAIELDGRQHNTQQARRRDKLRSRHIQKQGIRVLRFWNHDVLQDTDTVLEAIWNVLHHRQGTLTPDPSPKGRGEPVWTPRPEQSRTSNPAPIIHIAVTKLRMDSLTNQQLTEYVDSGQWEGKAGAFGYQDGLDWVHVIEGSESNVVGLPMELLAEMLQELATKVDEGDVR